MRDADVRTAVREMLAVQHAGESDTRIVEEMGIWSGAVRVDVAVINGELSGFEFKSDRDTLQRLPAQLAMYNQIFDKVNLVVGSRHAQKASAAIPDWWGIIVATESENAGVHMHSIRPARQNPCVDPLMLLRLLWKSECIAILALHNRARGWRSKPLSDIQHKLAQEFPLDELKAFVRTALKTRPEWLGKAICDQT